MVHLFVCIPIHIFSLIGLVFHSSYVSISHHFSNFFHAVIQGMWTPIEAKDQNGEYQFWFSHYHYNIWWVLFLLWIRFASYRQIKIMKTSIEFSYLDGKSNSILFGWIYFQHVLLTGPVDCVQTILWHYSCILGAHLHNFVLLYIM
jgi:hypothetical protein